MEDIMGFISNQQQEFENAVKQSTKSVVGSFGLFMGAIVLFLIFAAIFGDIAIIK